MLHRLPVLIAVVVAAAAAAAPADVLGAGAPATARSDAAAPREPAAPLPVLQKDFRTFLGWFEGRFDNGEQVAFAPELGIPADAVPERIHSIFRRVELPAFGEHVYYVEQYLDGEPTKIYRQRLYTFALDEQERAIRLEILVPNDPAPLVDAHREPAKLAGLTPDGVRRVPGCEVWWRRRGDAFEGSTKPGACTVRSTRSGRTIVVSDDLYLDADEIWIHDRAVDTDGKRVYGNPAGIPHRLRRVTEFSCWLSVLRTGAQEDAAGAWSFDRNIAVHDGGEMVWVKTDARESRVGLKIRRPVWPSGSNQDSLVLYLHDESAERPQRAAGYGWADPGAVRVGLNLRWAQASCTRAR